MPSVASNLSPLPQSAKFHLDTPRGNSASSTGFLLSGWAINKTSKITSVSFYLSEKKICHVTELIKRPDVTKDYPEYQNSVNSGFDFFVKDLPVGKHKLEATVTIEGKECIAFSKELQIVPNFAFELGGSPVIIAGTPGSGTRVFCQICIDAGIFMGTHLTDGNDSMDLLDFFDKWVDLWIYEKAKPLTTEQKNKMTRDLRESLVKHLTDIPTENSRWGAKNPRSIHLLSFYHKIYPKMKFIHVVRDGRDMMYSKNGVRVVEQHGATILRRKLSEPIDRLHVWSIVNLDAAAYGETVMKENYIRIRFEDLCHSPEKTVKLILDFLGTPNADLTELIKGITVPSSTGRWKENEKDLENIAKLDLVALERFGYL